MVTVDVNTLVPWVCLSLSPKVCRGVVDVQGPRQPRERPFRFAAGRTCSLRRQRSHTTVQLS